MKRATRSIPNESGGAPVFVLVACSTFLLLFAVCLFAGVLDGSTTFDDLGWQRVARLERGAYRIDIEGVNKVEVRSEKGAKLVDVCPDGFVPSRTRIDWQIDPKRVKMPVPGGPAAVVLRVGDNGTPFLYTRRLRLDVKSDSVLWATINLPWTTGNFYHNQGGVKVLIRKEGGGPFRRLLGMRFRGDKGVCL